MRVYINDDSIEGQAETEIEAISLLQELAKAIASSSSLAQAGKAYRTRNFAHKAIMPNVTVHSLIGRHLHNKQHADITQFILSTVLTLPVDKLYHESGEHTVTRADGQCLKGTCFDSAVQASCGALVISALKSQSSQAERFFVSSSIYGNKYIKNACEAGKIEAQAWIFEHNPKHKKAPTNAKGGVASVMDLPAAQAQEVLSNGIMVGNRVYGYLNDAWYQFHCHKEGLYHGFRIELKASNSDHMKALKAAETLGYQRCGQVYT
jgi:hypothetical protein